MRVGGVQQRKRKREQEEQAAGVGTSLLALHFGVRILLGILLTTASSKARELDFAGFQEGGSAGGYPGGFGQARWHRF